MNKDNFFLGLLAGLIVPLLGVVMVYVYKYLPQNVSPSEFLFLIKTNKYNIPRVLSLGLLACIPLIAYYKNRKRFITLKGIFVAIIFYGLIAMAYKFNIF